MKKAYIGKLVEDTSYIPLLYPNLGRLYKKDRIFLDVPSDSFKEKIIEIVDVPEKSDFILLPHEYYFVRNMKDYVDSYVNLAQNLGKALIIFDPSDFKHDTDFPNTISLKYSVNRSEKKRNEIVIPPIVENLGKNKIIIKKKPEVLTVGFCGWADYGSTKSKIASLLKLGGSNQKGLKVRKKVISELEKSTKIDTNFIIRKSFSGHSATIELDAEKARREYIDNMLSSDIALVARGDGNYSLRFYEALSLGKIPLLIDTDTLLPLEAEGEINYEEFIVRLDASEIGEVEEVVLDWFKKISDDEFVYMQKKAFEVFNTKLDNEKFIYNLIYKHNFYIDKIVNSRNFSIG